MKNAGDFLWVIIWYTPNMQILQKLKLQDHTFFENPLHFGLLLTNQPCTRSLMINKFKKIIINTPKIHKPARNPSQDLVKKEATLIKCKIPVDDYMLLGNFMSKLPIQIPELSWYNCTTLCRLLSADLPLKRLWL